MRLAVNGQTRQDALLPRDDPRARGDADRTGGDARPARRRPDRHRHAGRLRGACARASWRCSCCATCVSDATKWRLFIRKSRANPAYLRPGDRLSLTIRTDDGAIDLGEQTTAITTD